MSMFVEVAKKSQIPEGGVIGGVIGDTAHEAGPLSEGQIVGEDIEFPWHRSCFDVRTGRVTRDPATEDVATFKVRIDGDSVQVDI